MTFMLVFYLSHCYARFMNFFADVEAIMSGIISVCSFGNVAGLDLTWWHDLT